MYVVFFVVCYASGLCKCNAVISGVRVVCMKFGLCMLYVCLGCFVKSFCGICVLCCVEIVFVMCFWVVFCCP